MNGEKTIEEILNDSGRRSLWSKLKWVIFKRLIKNLVEYRLIGLDGVLLYVGPRKMTATLTKITEESAMCKVIINLPPAREKDKVLLSKKVGDSTFAPPKNYAPAPFVLPTKKPGEYRPAPFLMKEPGPEPVDSGTALFEVRIK